VAERRPVRAIVLDFNGTLAQDDHVVAPLYVDTFASIGVPLTVEQYHRELSALPDREVFALALSRAGLPADEQRRDALVRKRVAGYLDAVAGVQPIGAAAAAFVRSASARVALAIASGAFREEIEYVLDAAGLAEHFPVIVSIEDVVNGKPDPEGFTHAVAELNRALAPDPPIESRDAAAIEDATGGAGAARAAGMRVAAIRGVGYDPTSGCADVIIDRLEPAALETILTIPERP
jgi:beta-phosphoglucomutase-like phosphatase (HAD superfamily)